MTNIKHLKPRKNGYYRQGYINPNRLKKYADSCKNEPVIFRSGLEEQFINYLELNSSIAKWASECMSIPYWSRLDKKECNYYPDYLIENKDGVKVIVEVKPFKQTKKPRMQDSDWLKKAWIKNCDKWKAAKEFADKHGMKFVIVTEKFFN